ncbi:MAG: alpha/beta hydrolase [Dehalococcoidia bacterium]|nr:alpha/beta hydrolase [Dehalococcoidia bacterium]
MPYASVNGLNVEYSVEGSGEPLLMIMGFASARSGWVFQKRALRKHFRLVTFNNRGVGKTHRPEVPCSIRMMADDAVGLMDHLGIEKAHVLGVSMGGYIAQELAINYPERVKRLVLGCTYAREDETGGHTAQYFQGLGLREGCSSEEMEAVPIASVLRTVFSLGFNGRLIGIAAGPLLRLYARRKATMGVAAQFRAIVHHDTLDRLHLIKSPTLVITGFCDRVIKPASSEVLARLIPDARLITVEGGSHSFFIGQRGRFNKEVIDFLKAS